LNYKKLLIFIAEGLSYLGLTKNVKREEDYIEFDLINSNKHFTIKLDSDDNLKIYMRENNMDVKSFNVKNDTNKFNVLKKIKNILNKEG
jgi:hypothetical protein